MIYLEVESLDSSLDPWYGMERRCEIFTVPAGGSIELIGTPGPDVIALTRGDEDLAAPTGSLSILVRGRGGNDVIVGSDDPSVAQDFRGQSGNDFIYLRNAGGQAKGGPGDDTLWGGIEPDDLLGGSGRDTLHSGGGLGNFLDGGPGIDTYEEWGVVTSETESIEFSPSDFDTPLTSLYASVGRLHADFGGDWAFAEISLLGQDPPRLLIVDPISSSSPWAALSGDLTLPGSIDLTVERGVELRTGDHTLTIKGRVMGLASGALTVEEVGGKEGAFVFDGNTEIHVNWFSDAGDTAKAERAIDAATWSAAKTVFFPAGAYGLGPSSRNGLASIALNNAAAPSLGGVTYSYDGLVFSGAGREATRLEWIGGPFSLNTGTALFRFDARSQPMDDVTIKKMTLEGNADWNFLYDFSGTVSDDCTNEASDVSILSVLAIGPAYATASGALGLTNMSVEEVTTKFARTGFTLRDGEWTLYGVKTRDHTCHGLGITDNADILVSYSRFERSGGALDVSGGLTDLLGARVTTFIHDSTFSGNRYYGGKFGSSAKLAAAAALNGHYVNGDRELIEGTLELFDVTFENNRQSGFTSSLPGFAGVFTTPSSGGTSVDIYLDLNLTFECTRCTMERNEGRGLNLGVEDDCHVSTGCHGIRARLAEGSFSENGVNGIQIVGDASLELTGGDVHDNGRHGIYTQSERLMLDLADIRGNNPSSYSGIRLVDTPGRTGTATIRDTTIVHCAGTPGCSSVIPEGTGTVNVEITDSAIERLHTGTSVSSQFFLLGTVYCHTPIPGSGSVAGSCVP
ncbi:MAG: calcium-binding protein [Acidobacteriota bacterium]